MKSIQYTESTPNLQIKPILGTIVPIVLPQMVNHKLRIANLKTLLTFKIDSLTEVVVQPLIYPPQFGGKCFSNVRKENQ